MSAQPVASGRIYVLVYAGVQDHSLTLRMCACHDSINICVAVTRGAKRQGVGAHKWVQVLVNDGKRTTHTQTESFPNKTITNAHKL